MMQIEINLAAILSLLAISLSAYSISIAKKRNENSDLKEVTATLTRLETIMGTLEKAVLGTPSINEQVAVHKEKIAEHERRITALEQKWEEK